jgi:hypothetical protein
LAASSLGTARLPARAAATGDRPTPEFAADFAEPAADFAEPAADFAEPAADFAEPAADFAEPAADFAVPARARDAGTGFSGVRVTAVERPARGAGVAAAALDGVPEMIFLPALAVRVVGAFLAAAIRVFLLANDCGLVSARRLRRSGLDTGSRRRC